MNSSYVQRAAISLTISILAICALLTPGMSIAAVECDFTRDLEDGIEGEDVRCLQKYLNGTGFVIAGSGVGAPGHETDQFKTLTKEALIKWQTANALSPAIGYFGPLSRQKYIELVQNVTPAAVISDDGTTAAALKDQLA